MGDVLTPALDRLASGAQAKAYAAWTRAAGDQVAGGARPRNFSRGTLTVECTSSVWANELTYLGGQIMARMDATSPGHPVKKLRFTVARSPREQEDPPAASQGPARREPPAPLELEEARDQAAEVRDERLRAAIEALLRAPRGAPPEPLDEGTPSG